MGVLFDALACIPKLVEFIEWIASQMKSAKVRRLTAQQANVVIDIAKQTKDTSGIDQLFK